MVLLAVAALSWPAKVARAAAEISLQDIEESLTCQCGCGLTVHSCNHVDCSSALPLRREIREHMALGKSKQEILAYFEAKYGEKILSSPVARGFNVLAWVTPFFALALGGVFVGWTVHRWVTRRGAAARTAPRQEDAPTMSPGDRERLRAELERFEE